MIVVLLSTLALAAALWAPRSAAMAPLSARLERWETQLRRRGPLVVALISIGVIWFTWDQIVPIPKVHDENSYLLQADIFASGRWTAPSPPIPDFFEQPHVQVVPRLASKYPPGHALLLTLGSLAHFPPLVPLLLTGLTAALVFSLATRLTDPFTGLLTWLVWLTAPIVLRFQPSYFSELTTTPALLASWWLLLDWRALRLGRSLLLMALAIGWGAITRPYTMLALALPIGVVVVRDVARLRLWRQLALASGVGIAVLGIIPLWSARTTGDWRLWPQEQYRRDYMPFDKLGFTADTSPPRRLVSPVLKATYDYFLAARKEQTLAAVPRTIADRAIAIAIATFQESRLPLALLAAIGLFAASGALATALRFGAVSGLALFLMYVPYPHWAPWTLYYLETIPLLSALVAVGTGIAARRVLGAAQSAATVRTALALVTLVLAAFAVPTVFKWKQDHRDRGNFDRFFRTQIAKLPTPAIVFVQYSPRVVQHIAEVFNYADLDAAPVWVVHDMGPRNAELRKLAPNRASFDFQEDQLVIGLRRR